MCWLVFVFKRAIIIFAYSFADREPTPNLSMLFSFIRRLAFLRALRFRHFWICSFVFAHSSSSFSRSRCASCE